MQLAETQVPVPYVIARGTEETIEFPDPTWTSQESELRNFKINVHNNYATL